MVTLTYVILLIIVLDARTSTLKQLTACVDLAIRTLILLGTITSCTCPMACLTIGCVQEIKTIRRTQTDSILKISLHF
jgi:hypothetical protein